MTRAWIGYLAVLVAASGTACSTKHQAGGPTTDVCLENPPPVEQEPAPAEELAQNEAAPEDTEECTDSAAAEEQVAKR